MQFIDSHSHLNSDAFDEDRDEVIARMKAAGMAAAMVIACEDDELPKLEALLAEHPGWLFGAWALHPEFPDKPEPTVERIAEICSRPGFAAVGETGLDSTGARSRLTGSAHVFAATSRPRRPSASPSSSTRATASARPSKSSATCMRATSAS